MKKTKLPGIRAVMICCYYMQRNLKGKKNDEPFWFTIESIRRKLWSILTLEEKQNNESKRLTRYLLSNNLIILSLVLTLVLIVLLTLLFLPYYLLFIFYHIVNPILLPYGFPYYLPYHLTIATYHRGFDRG